MFISEPIDGLVYFAERTRRGQVRLHGLRWCKIAIASGPEEIVEAGDVPRHVRNKAYKMFEYDRKRG
jgi:hypothetical protein